MAPPGPVKIGHKKDGHQRRPHRFHVSLPPPPYPAAGSTTDCTNKGLFKVTNFCSHVFTSINTLYLNTERVKFHF